MKLFTTAIALIALMSATACNDQSQQGYDQSQQGQPGYAPQQDHMVRDGLIGGMVGYWLGRSHGGGGYGYHPAYGYRPAPVIVQHTYVTHNYVRPTYVAPRTFNTYRPTYTGTSSYSTYRPSYSSGSGFSGGSSFRSYRKH